MLLQNCVITRTKQKPQLQSLLQFISSWVYQLSFVPMVNRIVHPRFGTQKLVLEKDIAASSVDTFGRWSQDGAVTAFQYFSQWSEFA